VHKIFPAEYDPVLRFVRDAFSYPNNSADTRLSQPSRSQ
jgi:hypothetical protein